MNKFRKAVTLFDDYYEMMSDSVRMEAYSKALSKAVKPGDIVVDLGAGLGILTFMALKAGAKRVYAIEKTDSIRLAMQVAEVNGLADRIIFINNNSMEVKIPEKADIIISETLGCFAVDENTLQFIIDARDRFLKPDGLLLPHRLSLYIAPVEIAVINNRMNFWKDLYGINFSPALDELSGKLQYQQIKTSEIAADPQLYYEIDLYKIVLPTITNQLTFTIVRKAQIQGLGGWFSAELDKDISIKTAPWEKKTHWKQAFFPLKTPVNVIKGDQMKMSLTISGAVSDIDGAKIDYSCWFSQLEQGRIAQSGSEKIGRNDSCPCGSGKKFKKCCM
ncbi:MAG: 50S ribosomal protein L11 methyltransferase [Nitrospirae bacterium]|nr:50S ribosomal protein L11 methyltransferase [Nitrospirota bacterium]MBF0541069.1 50S ribosomal protein L11 methyltransferase [Nitrospirota bacterium]